MRFSLWRRLAIAVRAAVRADALDEAWRWAEAGRASLHSLWLRAVYEGPVNVRSDALREILVGLDAVECELGFVLHGKVPA